MLGLTKVQLIICVILAILILTFEYRNQFYTIFFLLYVISSPFLSDLFSAPPLRLFRQSLYTQPLSPPPLRRHKKKDDFSCYLLQNIISLPILKALYYIHNCIVQFIFELKSYNIHCQKKKKIIQYSNYFKMKLSCIQIVDYAFISYFLYITKITLWAYSSLFAYFLNFRYHKVIFFIFFSDIIIHPIHPSLHY